MNETTCPWCEAELTLNAADAAEETCPECLTTWRYEEDPAEFALAA